MSRCTLGKSSGRGAPGTPATSPTRSASQNRPSTPGSSGKRVPARARGSAPGTPATSPQSSPRATDQRPTSASMVPVPRRKQNAAGTPNTSPSARTRGHARGPNASPCISPREIVTSAASSSSPPMQLQRRMPHRGAPSPCPSPKGSPANDDQANMREQDGSDNGDSRWNLRTEVEPEFSSPQPKGAKSGLPRRNYASGTPNASPCVSPSRAAQSKAILEANSLSPADIGISRIQRCTAGTPPTSPNIGRTSNHEFHASQ